MLGDAVKSKHTLPRTWHSPLSKMLKWLITSMEIKRYKHKTCYDVKTGVYNIYANTRKQTA